MPLLLTAHSAAADRRMLLRAGQEARVGRSEWVEMSFPEDASLAQEHFVVRCGNDALVEVLDQQHSLVVDGNPVNQLSISGQRDDSMQFVAGCTHFAVVWSAEIAPAEISSDRCCRADAADVSLDHSEAIADVVKKMALSKDAAALAVSPDQRVQFLERLVDAKLDDDALRFIAGILPVAEAVRWAATSPCADQDESEPLTSDIWRWIESGQQTDRRQVHRSLAAAAPSKRLQWLAEAVVYSGGSLAPDGQPVITPPPHLSAIAVLTSIRWALAGQQDRSSAIQRWIDAGRQSLANMETPTEETDDATGSTVV